MRLFNHHHQGNGHHPSLLSHEKVVDSSLGDGMDKKESKVRLKGWRERERERATKRNAILFARKTVRVNWRECKSPRPLLV